MCADAAMTFTIHDLAAFDQSHLREVISSARGALAPSLVGRALAPDPRSEFGPEAALAERIERALPPDDRAAFARERQRETTPGERSEARRAVLDYLYWELTYWKTPQEYELLTAGEQVHPGALDFACVDGGVALDAGAGSGRMTLPLARRAARVFAVDPAPSLLTLLEDKVARAGARNVELLRGVFRRLPLPDDSVDAVVSCSAFGVSDACGGDRGLDELMRVARPGARIVIMWPGEPEWFVRRGFHYVALPGRLTNTFPSLERALAVARRFYGAAAVRYLEATQRPELPFEILGVKAPRDLCWLTVRK